MPQKTDSLTPEEEARLRESVAEAGEECWACREYSDPDVRALLATLDAARSTATPDRDALREALAVALHAAGIGCMMPIRVCEPSDPRYADFHPAQADAILAHPAARAALAGSGPAHPHDGYAYDGCVCVCCLNVRALATLDAARSTATPDPYDSLSEHERQSANGTHLFDEACRLCARSTATPDRAALIEARHRFQRHDGPADHLACRRWAEEVMEVAALAGSGPEVHGYPAAHIEAYDRMRAGSGPEAGLREGTRAVPAASADEGAAILARLRTAGVITDGTYGPYIDPEKVLALAGSGPEAGLCASCHHPIAHHLGEWGCYCRCAATPTASPTATGERE